MSKSIIPASMQSFYDDYHFSPAVVDGGACGESLTAANRLIGPACRLRSRSTRYFPVTTFLADSCDRLKLANVAEPLSLIFSANPSGSFPSTVFLGSTMPS